VEDVGGGRGGGRQRKAARARSVVATTDRSDDPWSFAAGQNGLTNQVD
jgi:hypothetical protein